MEQTPPYTYQYPKADITVDVVPFGISPEGQLMVAMIRRKEDPYKGQLALPGGFIEFLKGETAIEAARRELVEETGLEIAHLEQLGTFDRPDRDPRGRTFSVAHMALVRTVDHKTTAGSDASEAMWLSVDLVVMGDFSGREKLAFDHAEILSTAVSRLRGKVRYAPIGFNLVPEAFTLTDLRKLYEAILGQALENHNFRKKVLTLSAAIEAQVGEPLLREVGLVNETSRPGPPAKLYSFNLNAYETATRRGINFEL